MKLKKGDVYKEAKGLVYYKITSINKWFNLIYAKASYNDRFEVLISKPFFLNQIHTGKLIKIPQLYK